MTYSIDNLREKFKNEGHKKYVQKGMDRPYSPADFHEIDKSIIFQIEYRETLLEIYKNSLVKPYHDNIKNIFNSTNEEFSLLNRELQKNYIEPENIYESQASNAFEDIIFSVIERGNEHSFWLDLDQNDQVLPARKEILNAFSSQNIYRFEENKSAGNFRNDTGQRNKLFNMYTERLKIDVAKLLKPTDVKFDNAPAF